MTSFPRPGPEAALDERDVRVELVDFFALLVDFDAVFFAAGFFVPAEERLLARDDVLLAPVSAALVEESSVIVESCGAVRTVETRRWPSGTEATLATAPGSVKQGKTALRPRDLQTRA
jgi:hypothetical protein